IDIVQRSHLSISTLKVINCDLSVQGVLDLPEAKEVKLSQDEDFDDEETLDILTRKQFPDLYLPVFFGSPATLRTLIQMVKSSDPSITIRLNIRESHMKKFFSAHNIEFFEDLIFDRSDEDLNQAVDGCSNLGRHFLIYHKGGLLKINVGGDRYNREYCTVHIMNSRRPPDSGEPMFNF
ncbi:hypothetical protein PFISCL1PPCAC_25100, partial [Pristionchus fissidentatus]